MNSIERLGMCFGNDVLGKIRLNNETKNQQLRILKIIIFSSNTVSENSGEKRFTIGEPINIGETETISIEKPKETVDEKGITVSRTT